MHNPMMTESGPNFKMDTQSTTSYLTRLTSIPGRGQAVQAVQAVVVVSLTVVEPIEVEEEGELIQHIIALGNGIGLRLPKETRY